MGQVELWIGRAGTGKSEEIAESIATEVSARPLGGKIFWVVPETVSFAAERRLMAAVQSTVRAEVLSLPRLALRVQSETPVVDGTPVNTTGKRLILAQVLKEAGPLLSILQRVRPTLSFLDAILAAFDEMSAHRVSMARIEATLELASTQIDDMEHPIAAKTGRRLLGKLGDLCTLYFLYQRELERRERFDESELMDRVHEALATCPSLDGATIYIDGFRQLQPRELHFALGLAEVCDKVILVMTADAEWFSPAGQSPVKRAPHMPRLSTMSPTLTDIRAHLTHPGDVFAPEAMRLYEEWVSGCYELGFELKVRTFSQPKGADGFREDAGMLDFIERHLVSETPRQQLFAQKPTALERQVFRVATAEDMRAEVEGIAADILSQVYDDSVCYNEVMVIVPNLQDYAALLGEVFSRFDIPFDLPDAPPLTTHPLAKFILGALAAVEENMSISSVLRILKTEFCGLERDDADWLEGYLVRHDISGLAAWRVRDDEGWRYAREASDRQGANTGAQIEDERANRLRLVMMNYLVPFLEQFRAPECTTQQVAEAVWALLEAVRAKRRMASWLVDEGNTDDPQAASVHEQVWQRVLEILNDLTRDEVSGDGEASGDGKAHTLPRNFVFDSIRTDMASQSLGTVPAGLESVLITDTERAAALHVPVVYVIGLNDGVLPRRVRTVGLLSDEERRQFQVLFGQRLDDTTEDKQWAEQWRVYMTLTRATKSLTLTYPLASVNGKELRPSSVISRVQSFFAASDRMTLWFADNTATNVHDVVWTPATALHWLLSTLREVSQGEEVPNGTSLLFHWLAAKPTFAAKLDVALSGVFHRAMARPLSPPDAMALFGNPLAVNVYQLETLASCPYKHFVQYGLRLAEPAERDATRAERGTLIHAAFAEFVEHWRHQPDDWRALTDEEAVQSMTGVFQDLLKRPQFTVWTRSQMRAQGALEALEVAGRAAIVLTRHTRVSRFLPMQLEAAFGTGEEGSYKAYTFAQSDGTEVQVRGRIDRIDVASLGDEHRFRIIDYKSRVMSIDLFKVYHGLQLQLPVYAAVVQAAEHEVFGHPAKSAGFFYLPLVRKLETRNSPEEADIAREKSLGRMQARGLWRDDEVSIGWMDHRLPNAENSELFPKMYKQDGTLGKLAPALSDSDWDQMEQWVMDKVRQLAVQIRSGDIAVSPYMLSRQDVACRTCSFAAICQIDTRFDSRPLRPLQKLNKEDILALWRTNVAPRETDREEHAE